MFWESGAGYNSEHTFFFFFLLDPVLSTNGCTGTQFMDAPAVPLHELKNQVVSVFYACRHRQWRTDKHNIPQLFEIKHRFKMPTGSTSPRVQTSSSSIKKTPKVFHVMCMIPLVPGGINRDLVL